MVELLAPAGNIDCAKTAVNAGADAVYIGLSAFSARQGAENFDLSALEELLTYAHCCGVKVYLAMNTLVKEGELDGFFQTLLSAWNLGVDAVIMQDIFLGKLLHERYPDLLLHLSTQAGVCTLEGALLAKEYGFSRVILARETPLAEIEKIAEVLETECFVQGALCTAFSGQCYFSSFVGGNSGNRGRCKQPCRKLYAYDRNGNTEKNYALSLSDLCVGEKVEKLIDAGVCSLKIEGRMRREEYVGAAVRYYRSLLDGKPLQSALSDLKRTYNRGNYTQGLAFGQDKRLLSTAVQGHLGEKVGVVKVVNGKYLVESAFAPQTGDAFKILREGKEVAGATFAGKVGKAFALSTKIRLKNGDGVFITTDTDVNRRVLSDTKKGKLCVSLRFHEGKPPVAQTEGLTVTGATPLPSAQTRPLTGEELTACFIKTDGLPVDVEIVKLDLQGNSFLPKSELNALRREFYAALRKKIGSGNNPQYAYPPLSAPVLQGRNGKTAVIADDFTDIAADIAVYKPKAYAAPLPESFVNGSFEKYLYYPAFATSKDAQLLRERLREGDFGIYAENYGGLYFAKKEGVRLFAGTGFHIFNTQSLAKLLEEDCVAYYALSKELTAEEGKALCSARAFALSSGDIKLMDLCYCPFGKSCGVCDKKEVYRLTDENGREFPVRRYTSATGDCRFEVYNCASLIGKGIAGAGQLLDLSVTAQKEGAFAARENEEKQKELYGQYTSGHFKKGVL